MPRLDRPRISQLVHLSGAQRGQTRNVWGITSLTIGDDSSIEAIAGDATATSPAAAVLMPDDEGWRLEAAPEAKVWVNGVRVRHRILRDGDLLEVGEGNLLRFRPRVQATPYKTIREALTDCVDTARLGGRGPLDRLAVLLRTAPYEMTTQVAPVVRLVGTIGLVAALASLGVLWARNNRLAGELAEQVARLDEITGLLEGSEGAAFTADDFAEVRDDLDFRIEDTLSRIEALENRATARGRAIAAASQAVVFLQGAYGFIEPSSGRPLRTEGSRLTAEGSGPLLELRYTGTGFILEDGIHVVTNRHVAQPWEFDSNAGRLTEQGFVPVMRRLIGYLPQTTEPFDVRIDIVHPSADAAVLERSAPSPGLVGLQLAEAGASIGDEVIVLGYPTGMRALLARADPTFVSALFEAGPVGFWDLATKLSAGGYIAPLATVGVVGQATRAALVYDAETTHGGSGGPVLGLDGLVVAVNAAILPEFGGSNLGVPAGVVLEMLRDEAADIE